MFLRVFHIPHSLKQKHRSPLHGSAFSVIVYGCPPRQSLSAQSWQPLPRSGCTSGRCPSFEAQHRGPTTSAFSTSHSGAPACPRVLTLGPLHLLFFLPARFPSEYPSAHNSTSPARPFPTPQHPLLCLPPQPCYHLTSCISLFPSFPHGMYIPQQKMLYVLPASLISIVVVTLLS